MDKNIEAQPSSGSEELHQLHADVFSAAKRKVEAEDRRLEKRVTEGDEEADELLKVRNRKYESEAEKQRQGEALIEYLTSCDDSDLGKLGITREQANQAIEDVRAVDTNDRESYQVKQAFASLGLGTVPEGLSYVVHTDCAKVQGRVDGKSSEEEYKIIKIAADLESNRPEIIILDTKNSNKYVVLRDGEADKQGAVFELDGSKLDMFDDINEARKDLRLHKELPLNKAALIHYQGVLN